MNIFSLYSFVFDLVLNEMALNGVLVLLLHQFAGTFTIRHSNGVYLAIAAVQLKHQSAKKIPLENIAHEIPKNKVPFCTNYAFINICETETSDTPLSCFISNSIRYADMQK